MFNKKFFSLILIISIFLPVFASADYLGQRVNFFVASEFDNLGRTQVSATLEKISSHLYFYVEDGWLNSLTPVERDQVYSSFNNLITEFDSKIYPLLTSYFGSEWNPGIDNDSKITILFHPMKNQAKGYFRNVDEYEKIQMPISNQREMVYLNSNFITDPLSKAYLAHEFVHLITFNQKDRILNVSEDTWLNEGRAEFAITLLGYNNNYQESYLKTRVTSFLENPFDSLTEWQGQSADYGVLNLFIHYLVDHYGVDILTDSLHSKKVGILSIDEFLKNHNYPENFSQVFANWTIAALINDCSVSEDYCYKNLNLKNVKIVPFNNFLPYSGKTTLSLTNSLKDWSAHWQKISGGKGNLKIEFEGLESGSFKVSYIIQNFSGTYSIGSFSLDNNQKGEIIVPDMGNKVSSIIIIPFSQGKTSNFNQYEPYYPYYLIISTTSQLPPSSQPETGNPSSGSQFQPTPGSLEAMLPFSVSKPLSEMSRHELLVILIQLLISLLQ